MSEERIHFGQRRLEVEEKQMAYWQRSLSTQSYTPFLSPSARTTNIMERRDAAAGRIWKEVSTVAQKVSKTVKKDKHKSNNE